MLFGRQPLAFKIPTAASNAFFLYCFFISVQLTTKGSVRGYLPWNSGISISSAGVTWSVSSARGSRVQTASERVQCKHEAQPLPAQSLPPLHSPNTSHLLRAVCEITHKLYNSHTNNQSINIRASFWHLAYMQSFLKLLIWPKITFCFGGLLQLNKIKLELHNHVRRWYVLFSLVK